VAKSNASSTQTGSAKRASKPARGTFVGATVRPQRVSRDFIDAMKSAGASEGLVRTVERQAKS
jgi:hypothetical protein